LLNSPVAKARLSLNISCCATEGVASDGVCATLSRRDNLVRRKSRYLVAVQCATVQQSIGEQPNALLRPYLRTRPGGVDVSPPANLQPNPMLSAS
jgi:hypothetical protein